VTEVKDLEEALLCAAFPQSMAVEIITLDGSLRVSNTNKNEKEYVSWYSYAISESQAM